VLELGCGTGRVLLPVAAAGLDVVGLDQSPAMLAIARQKLTTLDAETRARVQLIEGDMRSFDLGMDRFRLITIPFRAFCHLLTIPDQQAALLHLPTSDERWDARAQRVRSQP
jgi:ubiquinone/menaquinone biosynthesis C-methylase UbiE